MTSVHDHIDRTHPSVGSIADDDLADDWIGLAGYLAEAIAAGDITLATAQTELAAEATGLPERRALRRAVDFRHDPVRRRLTRYRNAALGAGAQCPDVRSRVAS